MNFPKIWSNRTFNWNADSKQLETEITHITPISKFKIINNNVLEDEQLSSINFKIIDNKGNIFNEESLNTMLKNNPKESEECNSELKNGIEADPPFSFVLQSNDTDIQNLDFQISWLYIKQIIL